MHGQLQDVGFFFITVLCFVVFLELIFKLHVSSKKLLLKSKWSQSLQMANHSSQVVQSSTLQPQTVAGAALLKGHALKVGENRKLAAHQVECSAEELSFIPLIVKQ